MERQNAIAKIQGGGEYPRIRGVVRFRQTNRGVIVSAEIMGLPTRPRRGCGDNIFGFHIHEGRECDMNNRPRGEMGEMGNNRDPFAAAMSHYNPGNCAHPFHSGDLPPLFGNNGYAQMSFLTDRFTVREIIGRVVIIHDQPDDFNSQPSGNSGEKIACGVIKAM
ncbi:MAG: superoxide dismutase family protein [Oscillospiraceae bacterium]